jgi:basic membrane lipoprotein Med (substrate-binding protein (PBP1-ABC) superfamily)
VDKKSTETRNIHEDENFEDKKLQGKLAKSMLVTGVLLVSAAVGPAVNYSVRSIAATASVDLSELNFNFDQWKEAQYMSTWAPSWQSADIEIYKKLTKDEGKKLEIYLAIYGKQEQGKEIINSKNRRYDDGFWKKSVPRSVAWKLIHTIKLL